MSFISLIVFRQKGFTYPKAQLSCHQYLIILLETILYLLRDGDGNYRMNLLRAMPCKKTPVIDRRNEGKDL